MTAKKKPRLTATNKVKAKLSEYCLTNEKIAKELGTVMKNRHFNLFMNLLSLQIRKCGLPMVA